MFSGHCLPVVDVGLPPRCPQLARCPCDEIEPFSPKRANNRLLTESNQPGKNTAPPRGTEPGSGRRQSLIYIHSLTVLS